MFPPEHYIYARGGETASCKFELRSLYSKELSCSHLLDVLELNPLIIASEIASEKQFFTF